MRKAILFDLDGTLLHMDLERFTKGYFGLLTQVMARHGYEPDRLIAALMTGIRAMGSGDGTKTCEQLFWDDAVQTLGESSRSDIPLFDAFYRNEFREAKRFTEPDPALAQAAVRAAHAHAQKVALATNPLFPFCAIEERLAWLGLTPADFDLVTSYETSRFSKPNPAYFAEVASALGVAPADCLMIGNDVGEDILPSAACGMDTLLITDCMLNPRQLPYRSVETTLAGIPAVLEKV